jgi:hypothetical protein
VATIKQELEQAAIEIGLGTFGQWLSNSDETVSEIVALLRSVATGIMSRHAWSLAKKTYSYTAPAETAIVPLPADFDRLQRTSEAVFEASPTMRHAEYCDDDGLWNDQLYVTFPRLYRRVSGGIEFRPSLPAGATMKIAYVSKNWIVGNLSTWTNEETDEPIFPSHLIRLGIIHRYQAIKGLAYADALAEFNSEMARAIAEDGPRRSIDFGERRRRLAGDYTVSVP